ncbi:hypothetical protein OAM00_00135 [Verrucomicrobia bacterium]|nr:hypothetical protein [Verrucomicrobiota bacterium]MDC0299171.1 hypothetical protein [Verrucomicrobiota bacterium]MDG1855740.1 hypothetical protein [Verrucomicrobiota bacterium]
MSYWIPPRLPVWTDSDEQEKPIRLALVLPLAMIEEFGDLRLFIIDEPTHGVDTDS